MLNQLVIVGRLANDIELKKGENGRDYANITVAVPRSYKNENGVYETDFINCTIFGPIAENTAKYMQKGDILGVKGRVQSNSIEKDGKTENRTNIIAEKVTFLSSKGREDQEHDER